MLKRFMTSDKIREQQVFHCMIQNLFEEYKWFGQYPDKELLITGILFGSIICNQLVAGMKLGVALRYVLEALRKPIDSQMFKFGYCALQQFRTRLPEWPQYCRHIVQLQHMRTHYPDVIQTIQNVLSAKSSQTGGPKLLDAPKPVVPIPGVTGRSNLERGKEMSFSPLMAKNPNENLPSISPQPSFSNNSNISVLLAAHDGTEPSFEPPQIVQDKIHFIFNNLSESNLDVKIKDLREILRPEIFSWFIQYICIKRVSQEPNFHILYSDFLSRIQEKSFRISLLKRLMSYVRTCLCSPTMMSSSSDRSLLKNLGHFLGLQTLARNRPILAKDISFKHLIFEAFQKNRLIYVIPFVAKVLETTVFSSVFKIPNPW
eukprot:Sdes_comp19022_c0_seq1m9575